MLKVGLHKVEHGFRYEEVVENRPKELVQDRSEGTGEVQHHNMPISPIYFGSLNSSESSLAGL